MTVNVNNRVVIRVWTSKENKQYPGQNVGHISIEIPSKNVYISLWPVPFTPEQVSEYREVLMQIEYLKNLQKGKAELELLIQEKLLELKKLSLKYFMERKANFHQTFADDYKAEGRTDPQVIICLYSLNAQAMEEMFRTLVTTIDTWRLIGSNLFVQKLESALDLLRLNSGIVESSVGKRTVDNCASLALKILKAGDITNLISLPEKSSFNTQTSSSVTPDQILDVLIPAKKNELQKHPETQTPEYTYPNETIVAIQNTEQSKTLDENARPCLVM